MLVTGVLLWPRQQELPVVEEYDPAGYLPVVARAPNMPPIFYVTTQARKMALTFDISWGEDTPDKVLDVLKQYDQKATFFLSGPWSQNHPEIVKRIAAEGHEIASHGWKHVNLSQYDAAYIKENIGQTHEVLKELTGQTPVFFRPPNGDYDDLSVRTAKEVGYETIIWSIDSLDWKNPGVDYMVRRVTREAFPGAIILFHASDSSKQTHTALPKVIARLRAEGWELVTLGELMKEGEPAREDPRGRPYKPNQPAKPKAAPSGDSPGSGSS